MTQELKSKLLILGVTVALFTTTLLTGCNKNTPIENTTYRFSGNVTHKTIDDLLNVFEEAEKVVTPNETFTLIITSPGGRVSAFRDFAHEFSRTKLQLTTKIYTQASSAGAFMFIRGHKRFMREDSIILFHYARVNYKGVEITTNLIEKYLNGKINNKRILSILNVIGKNTLIKVKKRLTKSNTEIYMYVKKYIGVKAALKVLIHGKDVILNAKEAKELGVATYIEKQRS